jgi:Domain of unknown function (DUF4278)
MKLTYRGIGYEYEQPTIDMLEGEIGGKYRGAAWTIRYPRHIPVQPLALNLKYRGIAYSTGSSAKIAPPHQQTPVSSELVETHRANIRRRLEHRLQVAKDQRNESLIRLLEAESKQLVGNLR